MNNRFTLPEAAVGAREGRLPRVCPLDTAIASARHLPAGLKSSKNEAVEAALRRNDRKASTISNKSTGLMSLYIRNEANNAFSAWLAYRSLCRKTKKERFGKSIFTR